MIELLPAPDHVVAYRVSGKVTKEDVEAVIRAIDERLAAHDQVSFYTEFDGLEGVSLDALLRDLKYGISQLRNLERFFRAAVVTDRRWLQTVVGIEDWLIPKIRIRTFPTAGREEARAWAAERPAAPGPTVERIPTSRSDVLAFEMRGPIAGEDLHRLAGDLQAAYEAHGSIRLLLRVSGRYGLHLDAVSPELVRMKLDALRHVERYALVDGPDWVAAAVRVMDPLFRMEVRHFPGEEEAAAWEWLEAAPAAPAGAVEEAA